MTEGEGRAGSVKITGGTMQTAAKTVKNIVIILFALIIVYLTVLSGFSTAVINADEHTCADRQDADFCFRSQ